MDGVVSPEGYLANYTSPAITHIDGIIASFFIYCHEAGPSKCPYYTGSTPKDIYERFNQSFAQLRPRKAEADHWSNATDLEAALLELKVALLTAADAPLDYFSSLPQILLGLESAVSAQNISSWTQQLTLVFGTPGPAGYENPEWTLGVLCADQNNSFYGKSLKDLAPEIKQLERQSIIGEIWTHAMLGCAGWSIKAKEIFTGPFAGHTATPILFVSNTYDAVTPIEEYVTASFNRR